MKEPRSAESTNEFGRMNRETLSLRSAESLLVIPIGATEQHGPGVPTATDTAHAEEVGRRSVEIASRKVPVILAPALPYGCSSHHLPFGATLSLGTSTLLTVLLDIGRSAVESGFRYIFFLNGHGGNHEVVELAARDLSVEQRCHAAGGSWWAMARPELLAAGAGVDASMPGHGGTFEASLVLALGYEIAASPSYDKPPATRPAREHGPYRAEFAGLWESEHGYSDDPRSAHESAGRRYLDVAAAAVADHLCDFYEQAKRLS